MRTDRRHPRAAGFVCFSGCEPSSRAAAAWAAETGLGCKGGCGRRKGRGVSEGRQAMAVGVKLLAGNSLASAWSLGLWFLGKGERAAPPPPVSRESLSFVTWRLWTPE